MTRISKIDFRMSVYGASSSVARNAVNKVERKDPASPAQNNLRQRKTEWPNARTEITAHLPSPSPAGVYLGPVQDYKNDIGLYGPK